MRMCGNGLLMLGLFAMSYTRGELSAGLIGSFRIDDGSESHRPVFNNNHLGDSKIDARQLNQYSAY